MIDTPEKSIEVTADDRPDGLILAGGRGLRMGGCNKGWILWRGRPLILHAIDRLRLQARSIAISSNTEVDRYRALGFPVVADRHADYRGPLAGIAAALAACGRPLLCVPVDAPRAPLDLGARLSAALAGTDAEVAIAHDGQRLQPLFALLRPELTDDLVRELDRSALAAGAWLSSRRHRVVDFSDQPGAFANLNRPEDLEAADDGVKT